jgi:hypothetical protein
VKRLRQHRGDLTQEDLRQCLSQKVSAGWLSGVENNNIEVAPDRRVLLADALGLVGSDRELLLSEESLGEHPENAYAAWQAVRLAFADGLAFHDQFGSEGRARALRARDKIRGALQDDPARRAGPGGLVGGLTHYQTLPVSTRWMLVVEAAFMDPFAPFEPADWFDKVVPTSVTEKVYINLEPILTRIVFELGLADVDYPVGVDVLVKKVASARQHKSYTGRKDLRAWSGVEAAFVDLGDESSSSRIVRGADEVGWLGWWTACGMYLVRNNWASGSSSLAAPGTAGTVPWAQLATGGLSRVSATLLGGSALGATTAMGVAAARAAEREGQRQGEAADPQAAAIRQAATFLDVLSGARVRQDLVRMWTFYAIDALGGVAGIEPSPDEPIPTREAAAQELILLAKEVGELRKELAATEHKESRTLTRLQGIEKELSEAAGSLDKLTA